jgi:hypothetical protein
MYALHVLYGSNKIERPPERTQDSKLKTRNRKDSSYLYNPTTIAYEDGDATVPHC